MHKKAENLVYSCVPALVWMAASIAKKTNKQTQQTCSSLFSVVVMLHPRGEEKLWLCQELKQNCREKEMKSEKGGKSCHVSPVGSQNKTALRKYTSTFLFCSSSVNNLARKQS